jgi:ketosteroid isomerase-like protein
MKKLLAATLITIVSTFAAFAQKSKAEQEILKIQASLDQAVLKKDIAVFERVLADDYVYSNAYGEAMNRAESLEDMRREWANTKFRKLTASTDDIKVKVSGNMALVTANWTATTIPRDVPNAEPHKDTGRYTGVYEKRGGKWLLVAEHFSEAPHDRKLMEQQVLKAGQEYVRMVKNQEDAAVLERIFADEYLFTSEKGKVTNKTESLVNYKNSDTKYELLEISDQKVRVIGNNAAIETGTIRFKGIAKGNPIDGSERYTTTWVWRGGRWQIVADHLSPLKE